MEITISSRIIPMNTNEAVEAFLKSRLAKGLKPETLKWYKTTLRPFAGAYPELPVIPEDIDDFLINRQSGDERRHGYFRAIRALYRFLKRRRNIENIVTLMEAPRREKKLPRPITLDALDQLLSYPHPQRIQAALMFMADSGARVGETARLQPADLAETEWGHAVIVNGKTGSRLVPVGENTYRLLVRSLPFNVSPGRMSHLASKAFREAHVVGSAHCLRHTFGTYWEGDEDVLQKILGHASITTTQLYRQLQVKKICQQHHEFSPLKMIYANRQISLPL